MTYLRLFWIHLRLGVLNELQYRTNLFVQIVQSVDRPGRPPCSGSASSSPRPTRSRAGRPAELLAIVGVFTCRLGHDAARGARRVWRASWRTCAWERSISR